MLAVLGALGVIPPDFLSRYIVLGELALDGGLLPISGALPAAMAAHARDLGIICPKLSGREAAWAGDALDILAPDNLVQLINHVKGTQVLSRPSPHLPFLNRHCRIFVKSRARNLLSVHLRWPLRAGITCS